MKEVFRCKVRDIKDSSGRWEIRLEHRNLPALITRLAGSQIELNLSGNRYKAHSGIASKATPGQYFWMNTHKAEAGPIKDVLRSHGYGPNDEILLAIDEARLTAYVTSPTEAKLRNIIDMGLGFSAMIRLFERKSKETLREKMLGEVQKVFEATSEDEFQHIHSEFCTWGTQNMAGRRKKQVVKPARLASYGQIAKTFDVVLKVAVYYCQLPNSKRSALISRWLNAAVDTKMMAMLKRHCPGHIGAWPRTIEQVDESAYMKIQKVVRKFIDEKHRGRITPAQFDDIYWEALNR